MISAAGSPGGTGSGDTPEGLLRSAVRRELVDVLADLGPEHRAEGLSAAELAEHVGLHVTTVRFHLTRLLEGGLIASHSVPTPGAGRPTKRYRTLPEVAPEAPERPHELLARLLTESFGARHEDGSPLRPEEAGARWARRQAATDAAGGFPTDTAVPWWAVVTALVDVLRAWGYHPDVGTEEGGHTTRIDLVGCPFIELARSHPDVACGIHSGLIRGTLDRLGEEDARMTLEPFVGPNRCRALVTTPTAPGGTT